MTCHILKTLPEFFWAQADGSKAFEVRENDRDFHVGDLLVLREYLPEGGCTGMELERRVTFLLDDPAFCKEGFVILGTEPPRGANGMMDALIEAGARLQAYERAVQAGELVRGPGRRNLGSPAVAERAEGRREGT